MGGCCSASQGTDTDGTPCPQTVEEREPESSTSVAVEEREPESSTSVASSADSPEIFFDANPESSVPDAYGAPPGHMQPTHSASVGEAVVEDENLKGSECESKAIGEQDCIKVVKGEPSEKTNKSDVLATEEEDECPTCLEAYDLKNPRIITYCRHHFHLSCIYEWLERSETCPICNQIMRFDVGGG